MDLNKKVLKIVKYLNNKLNHKFKYKAEEIKSSSWNIWFDLYCNKCNCKYYGYICDNKEKESMLNIGANLISIKNIHFIIKYGEIEENIHVSDFNKEAELLSCNEIIIKNIIE